MTAILRVLSLAIVALVLAACPRPTRRTLVPDVPQDGSAEARARFADARTKFLRDGSGGAEFRSISEEFPDDPIVPWANLFAGIAAVKERKFDVATKSLQAAIDAGADPGLTTRAQLFLGISLNYQGDPRRALSLLDKGKTAIENEGERTEHLAAFAYATAAAGERPLAALPMFDELYQRVTPTERAVIVGRVVELVGAAEPTALERMFDSLRVRNGPSMAAVATRLALLADQAGNASEAQRFREIAGPARVAVGLPRTVDPTIAAAPTGSGDANVVGAVLPLGSKQSRVAEAAAAGLGLAAGVTDGKGVAAVEVRAASDAETSASAVEDLARGNVVAVIGPIDSASVDAAGSRADSIGIPLLSLSTAAEKNAGGRFVFHMIHSGEARSRALAQRALAKGIKTFAVLAAENGYGRAMTAAFVDEVKKGGGSIISSVTYKPDTKSFAGFTIKLTGEWDAVFVPAQADVLGLIAPALAATGKIPKPVGTKKVIGGRPVLLLSTAENLTTAYLVDAGRHSTGAFFAPGYFPDDKDPASKAFLDRFIAAFGRAPGFLEAYAYDAAQLAAAAGGAGRAGLAQTLSTGELVGLTGVIRFDREHRRADPGVVYTVAEETGGTLAIRVVR
ncbi:MAG: penicillin-binding protein activator [Kofleriaceae bacterium]|nr:penicillin-binding protein activator [Kofleriaceae bacterium]